tara:strand:+ start:88 stop:327 length:240 start_codon:yes stop_codon:yes gene_type:complete
MSVMKKLDEIVNEFMDNIPKIEMNNKITDRKELIDRILDLSGDEFETKADYIELAKETENELFNRLININQQIIENGEK